MRAINYRRYLFSVVQAMNHLTEEELEELRKLLKLPKKDAQ